jgi:putative hydrolase of the HAD superfamily
MAVFLDALGTLVELRPPAPRLVALLGEAGFEVSDERAAGAFAAEIAYYLEHHLEGRDPESLDELRDRCAEVLRDALAVPGLGHAEARRAMLGSLRFEPVPEALDVLAGLRAEGHAMLIVSNWDCSLPQWLAHTGLLDLVEGVVTSASAGSAKPDPGIFERALQVVGARADQTLHVGDSIENDIAGARAAGIRPVLVRHDGPAPPGVETIATLRELPALL